MIPIARTVRRDASVWERMTDAIEGALWCCARAVRGGEDVVAPYPSPPTTAAHLSKAALHRQAKSEELIRAFTQRLGDARVEMWREEMTRGFTIRVRWPDGDVFQNFVSDFEIVGADSVHDVWLSVANAAVRWRRLYRVGGDEETLAAWGGA